MNTHMNTLSSLDGLVCTEKAHQSIQNFTTDLTGRERQLIVLMTRGTVLCNRACDMLLAKIDLESLIKRGYLNVENDFITDSSAASMTSPVITEDINPALNLVTGNF